MSKCNCSMRQQLAGDGCEHCNPDMAAKILKDNIAELEAINRELYEALRNCVGLVELKYGNTDPSANAAINQAREAINKAEGKP